MSFPQDDSSSRSILATLKLERQAIFSTDAPTAEKEEQWQRRKAEITAEITAYLANDDVAFIYNSIEHMQPCSPLERTLSNVSEGRKRAHQPSEEELQQGQSIFSRPLRVTKPLKSTRPHLHRPNTRDANCTYPPIDGHSDDFQGYGQADPQILNSASHYRQEEVVLDPLDWLASKQSVDAPKMKRQRSDGALAAATPSLSTPSMINQLQIVPPNLFTAPTPDITVTSGFNAQNYSLSSCSTDSSSFAGTDDMTRQGSTASSFSMTEGFGMMRVDSHSSNDVDGSFHFSFGELQDNSSFLSDSGITEKPVSSLRATTASEDSRLGLNDVFKNMGSGFDPDFLSNSLEFPSSVDLAGYELPWQRAPTSSEPCSIATMQRIDSQNSAVSTSSASSTDAQQRAILRLSKHIHNGATQQLLPKTSPVIHSKPAPKAIALYRQPSITKTKDPLKCSHCPKTLRGPHELQRHWENHHAAIKSVWICQQPEDSPIMPKKPLKICKQCRQGKPYNADYNAAAHLKRGHFHPSRRGRRPRGSIQPPPTDSATKDPGPPIEILKKYGWLKEIFVKNESKEAVADVDVEGGNDTFLDELDSDVHVSDSQDRNNGVQSVVAIDPCLSQTKSDSSLSFATQPIPTPPLDLQQVAFCTKALGFDMPNLSSVDEDFSLVETPNPQWSVAPPMAHSFSAP